MGLDGIVKYCPTSAKQTRLHLQPIVRHPNMSQQKGAQSV